MRFAALVATLLVAASSLGAGGLSGKLDRLLAAPAGPVQDSLLADVLKDNPTTDTVIALLRAIRFPKPRQRGVVIEQYTGIDGTTRPFGWYVPRTYNPARKMPLIVYLHGAVSSAELIANPGQFIQQSRYVPHFGDEGSILLFTFGQAGATWWDSVGMANVLGQIRLTKQRYNIDDNRVYLTGFSDGASGAFGFAMLRPDDFAAFIPLNGHVGVASIDGGIQTYLANLANRPLSVVNTDRDDLYPDRQIRPMMELALGAGADLLYRIYTGVGHEFTYAPRELPRMVRFMADHPRIAHPVRVVWETADPAYGRCAWLAVDSIRPTGHAPWYHDANMELVEERLAFGFMPDQTYQGPGLRISKLVGDTTFCTLAGVKEGDVLVRLDTMRVDSLDDVSAFKRGKTFGDSATMTVLRDGRELALPGRFPLARRFPLFKRDRPSARAEATFCANRFDVRGSQLGAFSIWIDPEMVQLDQNVVVTVSGTKVYDARVEPSVEQVLRDFLANRDREAIYVKKVSLRCE